ncbi:uncharacterized protein LOC143448412 [Clavelina lepadiformis]|uniref:uncharacterized protein LOC143448412 n=1 Tax=Clavelina lepadiformis TaxID=159417 RepID=UPI004042C554
MYANLFSIIPPNKPKNLYETTNLYKLDNLPNEVELWREGIQSTSSESILTLLEYCKCYPDVRDIMQIILVLPATTVEAECSFPTIRRVKTWLRSVMSTDRLFNIAVLNVHKQHLNEAFVECIIAMMGAENRRMKWM